MKGIPLIVLAVLLGATGQVIMKMGMTKYGKVSAGSVWGQLIPILTVPQVALDRFDPDWKDRLLVAVTEKRSKGEMDKYCRFLKQEFAS